MTSTFSASLEHWPLDRLIPHARNAQTHSEDHVGQIAGSIAEFGFVNPILVGARGKAGLRILRGRRPDCVADDAVHREPVSAPNSLANREINREFC
jgi:hypothetical protein